ncbi:MAG: DUF4249 domain-containing protein [Bacteroidota bacterium]
MKRLNIYVLALLAATTGFGCSDFFQTDIELDLPPHERQLVVECYLQPNFPILLSLTETLEYFGQPELPLVNDAEVSVSWRNRTVNLIYGPLVLPDGTVLDSGIYQPENLLTGIVPEDYNATFTLNVRTKDGRELTAETQLLREVPIDRIEWEFNDDSLAFVLTRFFDDGGQNNYYRRLFQVRDFQVERFVDGQGQVVSDTIRVVNDEQDFTADDRFSNGELVTFGTGFNYEKGDTVISTLYHINREYYDFLNTVDDAVAANSNPFGQPSRIISNIQGGTGIFTGIAVSRQERIIE